MNVFQKLVNSRKFWAFVTGLVTALAAAFQDGVITTEELWAVVGLVATYIFSIAFEDGMVARVNWNSVAPRAGVEQNITAETVNLKTQDKL